MTLSTDDVVSRFDGFMRRYSDSGYHMPEGMRAALAHIMRQRTQFRIAPDTCVMIAKRLNDQPLEWQRISGWLASTGQPEDTIVEVLWICGHFVVEWETLPKLTKSQHRKLYGQIETAANELVTLMTSTQEHYVRGGGHGLMGATIPELMTDEELTEVRDAGGGLDMHSVAYYIPNAEQIIERLGQAAARLRESGPTHPQPGKRGARNGYFVRHLRDTLTAAYGSVPDEVVATLANVALDLNDIDAALVRKLYR